MLKFYGDESFGKKQSGFQGCYAVAGYMSSGEVWHDDIADDWQKALDTPPGIQYFHMSDCFAAIESRQEEDDDPNPFTGMSSKDAREKLAAVVSVMEGHSHKLACVQSIITWDCFTDALNEADKELLQSPYYFCLTGIVDGCRQLLRDMSKEAPVAFVLDERRDVSELVHRAWNLTKDSSPGDAAIMGAITFADDKKCWPLQCADLLAWHVRRQFIQPAEDHGRSRPEYERLSASVGRWYSHVWNEEELRVDRAKQREVLRTTQRKHQKRLD